MYKYDHSEEKYDFKVWELRRIKVIEFINNIRRKTPCRVKKVLDIGCGEGKLLTYLLSLDMGIKKLIGVDIDVTSLEKAKNEITNLIKLIKIERKNLGQYTTKIRKRIDISLYHANLLQKNLYFQRKFSNFDLITFIEVIEHIPLNDAETCLDVLLGLYKPKFLVVTTPNKDYNVVFGMNDTQVRYYDHKFEWTKQQFNQICKKFSHKYGYNIEFDGVGYFNELYGFSTQICYFSKISRASLIHACRKKNIGEIKPFFSIRFKEKPKRKKVVEIANQIINAYNYYWNLESSYENYVEFNLIYSYKGIQKMFRSLDHFLRVIKKIDFEKFGIIINSQLGVQFSYPGSSSKEEELSD